VERRRREFGRSRCVRSAANDAVPKDDRKICAIGARSNAIDG
jgi:hypothetical protein